MHTNLIKGADGSCVWYERTPPPPHIHTHTTHTPTHTHTHSYQQSRRLTHICASKSILRLGCCPPRCERGYGSYVLFWVEYFVGVYMIALLWNGVRHQYDFSTCLLHILITYWDDSWSKQLPTQQTNHHLSVWSISLVDKSRHRIHFILRSKVLSLWIYGNNQ